MGLVGVEALVQLADPPSSGEVVHPHRRPERPSDAAVDQAISLEDRQEERQDLDEVGGVVAQPLALPQRFVDQSHVAALQVADPSVDELGAFRRCPGREVLGLDERSAQAAGGGVEGDADARDSTADDQHVEALAGQPIDHRRSIEWLLDRPRRRHARIIGMPRWPAPGALGRAVWVPSDCLWTERRRWF